MRTAHERKEAICWVLRRATVGDAVPEVLMFTARFIGKICGLPLWMVFYYTHELIEEGVVEGSISPNGQHVYRLK